MPQQVGHLYLWRRQGYATCRPWPARIAPADRCPNLLPANSSNVLIPAWAFINTKGPATGPFMFMAERQGFEPWNTREDVTGIPVQRLRPLGHLSQTFDRSTKSLVEGDSDWNSSSALLRTSMCFAPWADRRAVLANRSSS